MYNVYVKLYRQYSIMMSFSNPIVNSCWIVLQRYDLFACKKNRLQRQKQELRNKSHERKAKKQKKSQESG